MRLINAGSVGMLSGRAGATWHRLGPDVNLMRIAYDLARWARIRATAYPQTVEFAARHVLHPATEEDALRRLEPAAPRA